MKDETITQEQVDKAWHDGSKTGHKNGIKAAVLWLRESSGKLFAEKRDAEAKSLRDAADALEAAKC